MDHIADSGIILNETILTLKEICAFDSTLLNFLINSQYSKAANQKTILNKVFILPAKKTIMLNYFSIPPKMPTKYSLYYLI